VVLVLRRHAAHCGNALKKCRLPLETNLGNKAAPEYYRHFPGYIGVRFHVSNVLEMD
jgi:hypothetical protein